MKRSKRKGIRNTFFALLILGIMGILVFNSSQFQRIYYPLKYKEQVRKYSIESHVDPFLVLAIIKAESGFNPLATSPKSAKGLMQLMEPTAKEIAERLKIEDFESDDLYRPEMNIRIGCFHVRRLMNEFGDQQLDLVIAAYNGGSRNVKSWLKREEYSLNGKELHTIPFKETEKFLERVKRNYSSYKRLYENEF